MKFKHAKSTCVCSMWPWLYYSNAISFNPLDDLITL